MRRRGWRRGEECECGGVRGGCGGRRVSFWVGFCVGCGTGLLREGQEGLKRDGLLGWVMYMNFADEQVRKESFIRHIAHSYPYFPLQRHELVE